MTTVSGEPWLPPSRPHRHSQLDHLLRQRTSGWIGCSLVGIPSSSSFFPRPGFFPLAFPLASSWMEGGKPPGAWSNFIPACLPFWTFLIPLPSAIWSDGGVTSIFHGGAGEPRSLRSSISFVLPGKQILLLACFSSLLAFSCILYFLLSSGASLFLSFVAQRSNSTSNLTNLTSSFFPSSSPHHINNIKKRTSQHPCIIPRSLSS